MQIKERKQTKMDIKKVIKFCKAFGVPMYKICVEKNYNIVSVQSLIEMVKTLKKCGVKFKTVPLNVKLSDSYILNLVKLLIQNKLLDEKNMNAVNFADDVLQMCIKNKKCDLLKTGIEALKGGMQYE